MKLLTTKVHGVLDYLMGTILMASPWIFGFAGHPTAKSIPMVLGAIMILMSLFTNYELAVSRKLSMKTHLTVDFISGAFLAVSPWLFGFNEYVYLPHLVFGIAEMGAALITETKPHFNEQTPMTGHLR
ncbi:MAG: hypothetical protein H0W61_12735 [Bacteroidetes bacterium]|nr:hypothetical protein [Bacteroidota bacterium]